MLFRFPATLPTRPSARGLATDSSASTRRGREYASPNALSAYRRHGLARRSDRRASGDTDSGAAADRPDPVDDSVQSVLSGRTARRTELVSGEAHLMVRVLPLVGRPRAARHHRALP